MSTKIENCTFKVVSFGFKLNGYILTLENDFQILKNIRPTKASKTHRLPFNPSSQRSSSSLSFLIILGFCTSFELYLFSTTLVSLSLC